MLIDRTEFWKTPLKPLGLEKYVDTKLCPVKATHYYELIVDSMIEYHIIPDLMWTVVEKPEYRSFYQEWKGLGTGMLRRRIGNRWKDDQQTFSRCCGKLVESAIETRVSGQSLTKSYLAEQLTDICARDNRFIQKPAPERIAESIELLKLVVIQGSEMLMQLGVLHDRNLRVSAQTETVTSGHVDLLVTSASGHEMLVDLKAAAHLGSFHRDAQRVAGVPTSPKNEAQTLLYLLLLAADTSRTVPRYVVLVNPVLGVFEMLDVHRAAQDASAMSVIEHLGYRALMLDEERCERAIRRIAEV